MNQLAIDRIEVFVTELPTRIQRTFSSGSWDTGAPKQLLGKPVLVRLSADGVIGYGQIRPISPGHFVSDTVHSVVAAITDIYGPLRSYTMAVKEGMQYRFQITQANFSWPQLVPITDLASATAAIEAIVEQFEQIEDEYLRERKEAVYDNLRDLNFEYKAGKVPDADYQSMHAALEEEAAALLAEIARLEQASGQAR